MSMHGSKALQFLAGNIQKIHPIEKVNTGNCLLPKWVGQRLELYLNRTVGIANKG
jgi:hypothetical protein